MTQAELPASRSPIASRAAWLADRLRAAGPPLLFGLRLWGSVCLALYVAFWSRARQRLLGRHLGGDRVSAASRRVAAQRLVPPDRHGDRRRRDRRADRVLSARPRSVSRRLGAVGGRLRLCRHSFEGLCRLLSGAGRLHRRDTRAISSARPAARTGRPSCSPSTARARSASVSSAPGSFSPQRISAARRRLATLFAAISSEITGRFAGTLAAAGADFDDTQRVRRSSPGESSRSTR